MVYIERDIEKNIEKWLVSREILALRGPRQSGKTTILFKLKDRLKNKGAEDERIHYISFENDLDKIKFQENPKEFIEFYIKTGGKNYFMLDEVQYVKNIGKILKLLFDSYSNIKIIITGSSSFDLTNLGSFLVGRVIFFNIYPFNFAEFLRSKGENYEKIHKKIKIELLKNKIKLQKTIFLDQLNKLLQEYLTFGSYPRVVLEKDKKKKIELLKNLFSTYIEKDIVGLYGIKYREEVVKLLKIISSASGNIINYETLCVNSGLKYREIKKLLPLLEDSFIISITKPFYKNLVNELRKNPKIYFLDYGIKNLLLEENFNNLKFDKLYEDFVHNELKRDFPEIKYWRTTAKTEVDFVLQHKNDITPIEVKVQPKITRSFRSFLQVYKPKRGVLFNLNSIERKKINKCDVFVLPLVYI